MTDPKIQDGNRKPNWVFTQSIKKMYMLFQNWIAFSPWVTQLWSYWRYPTPYWNVGIRKFCCDKHRYRIELGSSENTYFGFRLTTCVSHRRHSTLLPVPDAMHLETSAYWKVGGDADCRRWARITAGNTCSAFESCIYPVSMLTLVTESRLVTRGEAPPISWNTPAVINSCVTVATWRTLW